MWISVIFAILMSLAVMALYFKTMKDIRQEERQDALERAARLRQNTQAKKWMVSEPVLH